MPEQPFTTVGFKAGFVSRDLRRAINQARRRRILDKPTFDNLDFQTKLTSWTVAGDLSEKSILSIQRAANTAIENGTSFSVFKKMITPTVLENIVVPRVVYNNAINHSYQRGRFEQQTRLKELRPFLEYVTAGDDRVRPNHAVMNGKVARQDSAFWAVNYPPNGHQCRCAARALSQRNIRQRNLNVQTNSQIKRSVRDEQTKKGIPLSKQAKPLADKDWRGSFAQDPNPVAPIVESFGKFPVNFTSLITRRPAKIKTRGRTE